MKRTSVTKYYEVSINPLVWQQNHENSPEKQ